MGLSIHGWVETKLLEDWVGVLRIDTIVGQTRHGHGTMFREEGLFEPIAANRGLPDDISEQTALERPIEWGGRMHTWAYWNEIQAIDWEEMSEPDAVIYKYVENADGEQSKKYHRRLSDMTDPLPIDPTVEADLEIEGITYSVVPIPPIKRRDALHPGWEIVFSVMSYLAQQTINKPENIRIVVWFV